MDDPISIIPPPNIIDILDVLLVPDSLVHLSGVRFRLIGATGFLFDHARDIFLDLDHVFLDPQFLTVYVLLHVGDGQWHLTRMRTGQISGDILRLRRRVPRGAG